MKETLRTKLSNINIEANHILNSSLMIRKDRSIYLLGATKVVHGLNYLEARIVAILEEDVLEMP